MMDQAFIAPEVPGRVEAIRRAKEARSDFPLIGRVAPWARAPRGRRAGPLAPRREQPRKADVPYGPAGVPQPGHRASRERHDGGSASYRSSLGGLELSGVSDWLVEAKTGQCAL